MATTAVVMQRMRLHGRPAFELTQQHIYGGPRGLRRWVRRPVGVARRTISGRWEVLGRPDRDGRREVLGRAQRLGLALELAGMEATR